MKRFITGITSNESRLEMDSEGLSSDDGVIWVADRRRRWTWRWRVCLKRI